MNILYIHGYGGTRNGTSARLLQKYIPNHTVIAPQFSNDIHSIDKDINRIQSICALKNISMIVGSSFGGLKTILSNVRVPKILVNPCLIPSKELYHVLLPSQVPSFLHDIDADIITTLNSQQLACNGQSPLLCFISLHDDLFGDAAVKKHIQLLKNHKTFILRNETSHRLTPHMAKLINKEVQHFEDLQACLNEDCFCYNDEFFNDANYDEFVSLTKGTQLYEEFKYIKNVSEKSRYIDEVLELIASAYGYVGGYASKDARKKFMDKTCFWRLDIDEEDGKINVVQILKGSPSKYRKSIALAVRPEKKDRKNILFDDNLKNLMNYKWFVECSHKPEKIMLELGYPVIPVDIVQKYFFKQKGIEITPTKNNHYIREIAGKPLEKIMLGFIPKELYES